MKNSTVSSLLCLLAAAIWGFAFTAQKAAVAVPPFMLTAARAWIAGVFLILVILLFDKLRGGHRKLFSKKGVGVTKKEWIAGLLCGLVLTCATVLQQFGIQETDAGKTAFITALYVVIVPICTLFIGVKAPLHVWISVAIAVVGFYFLCLTSSFSLAPSDLLVLLCALVFALHITVIDHFADACDGIRMSCIQFFTVAIVSTVLSLIFESGTPLSLLSDNLFAILFLGIGSSGIAYTAQILGQKGTNPTVATVILSLESVFGVLGGVIVLGESLSDREILGCFIVFFAVILSQLPVTEWVKRIKK